MLGGRKNRARHSAFECAYDCCRTTKGMTKSQVRRIIRKREKEKWKKDQE